LPGDSSPAPDEITPEVIAAAIESGRPIELAPDPTLKLPPDTPLADYGRLDQLMIFSAAAARALGPLLTSSCREVPVTGGRHELRAFELTAVEDVLDPEKSEFEWLDSRTKRWMSGVLKFAFFNDRLGSRAIFRIPQLQHYDLVLQPFVDVVRAGGFTGFRFRRVSPHTTLKHWV
jgi:hypothetical protein